MNVIWNIICHVDNLKNTSNKLLNHVLKIRF